MSSTKNDNAREDGVDRTCFPDLELHEKFYRFRRPRFRTRKRIYRQALREIVALMGPEVPKDLKCEGCRFEWEAALKTAKLALDGKSYWHEEWGL